MIGKVKWFNNKKGYGFITDDDGNNVFVHYSNILDDKRYKTLKAGETVTFIVSATEKGLEAERVRNWGNVIEEETYEI